MITPERCYLAVAVTLLLAVPGGIWMEKARRKDRSTTGPWLTLCSAIALEVLVLLL